MADRKCCGNCKYMRYDSRAENYICTNTESEYIADFVEEDHWCEDHEEKE